MEAIAGVLERSVRNAWSNWPDWENDDEFPDWENVGGNPPS